MTRLHISLPTGLLVPPTLTIFPRYPQDPCPPPFPSFSHSSSWTERWTGWRSMSPHTSPAPPPFSHMSLTDIALNRMAIGVVCPLTPPLLPLSHRSLLDGTLGRMAYSMSPHTSPLPQVPLGRSVGQDGVAGLL